MEEPKLNYLYAQQLGLSKDKIKKLENLYAMLVEIFRLQDEIKQKGELDSDTAKRLKIWDKMVEEIEYEMQETWGFGKRDNMLRYWFIQPLCTCPKRDNFERLGTGERVINTDCPIHGSINIEGEKIENSN